MLERGGGCGAVLGDWAQHGGDEVEKGSVVGHRVPLFPQALPRRTANRNTGHIRQPLSRRGCAGDVITLIRLHRCVYCIAATLHNFR